MKYSLQTELKMGIDTYNDIINLYNFFERIYTRSSLNSIPYKITSTVIIERIKARNLTKDEFINEAIGVTKIKLDDITLSIRKEELPPISILIFILGASPKDISIYSDNKLFIDEFVRLIENEQEIGKNDNKQIINPPVMNIGQLVLSTNKENSGNIVQSIDNTSEGSQKKDSKSWFEKYWFPLIIAILGVAGAIVAALIS